MWDANSTDGKDEIGADGANQSRRPPHFSFGSILKKMKIRKNNLAKILAAISDDADRTNRQSDRSRDDPIQGDSDNLHPIANLSFSEPLGCSTLSENGCSRTMALPCFSQLFTLLSSSILNTR